jgi:sulfate transport system permease protein
VADLPVAMSSGEASRPREPSASGGARALRWAGWARTGPASTGAARTRAGWTRASVPASVLSTGFTTAFLSLVVLLPIAALLVTGLRPGFAEAVTAPQAEAALVFTVGVSLVVSAIDVVAGLLVAWVLVRDEFPGRAVVDALVDLPFALPTIVAGLTLLALYGQDSPIGLDLAYTRPGVALALLFVTLPFVVRSVQPVLAEFDREAEEAAACLGAGRWTTFRRIVLPALRPALVAGGAQAFARSLGEFGSVVLISGNLPFRTEVASVVVAGQIENGVPEAAAAVAVVLLGAALAFVLLLRFAGSRAGSGAEFPAGPRAESPVAFPGGSAAQARTRGGGS